MNPPDVYHAAGYRFALLRHFGTKKNHTILDDGELDN